MRPTLFERGADDLSELVTRVVRAAREECADGECLVHSVLEDCAATAVRQYWDSPVKTFVPLLALRQVRDCIRAGKCPKMASSAPDLEFGQ